jgi:hypothetical protein
VVAFVEDLPEKLLFGVVLVDFFLLKNDDKLDFLVVDDLVDEPPKKDFDDVLGFE